MWLLLVFVAKDPKARAAHTNQIEQMARVVVIASHERYIL